MFINPKDLYYISKFVIFYYLAATSHKVRRLSKYKSMNLKEDWTRISRLVLWIKRTDSELRSGG